MFNELARKESFFSIAELQKCLTRNFSKREWHGKYKKKSVSAQAREQTTEHATERIRIVASWKTRIIERE